MSRRVLLAFAAALLPLTLAAQEPAGEAPREPWRWSLGGRLGAFEMIGSADSYDAVFGEPMPQVGLALEAEVRRHLLLALTYDYGRVEGEQVLPSRPPRPTGIAETLTYQPLAATAAWVANPDARWRFYAGGGATLLFWEDEGGTRSADGTDPGAHAVVGLRRAGEGFRWGAELRYSTVPDAIGEAGISRAFGEDDLGGLALTFVGMWRLR